MGRPHRSMMSTRGNSDQSRWDRSVADHGASAYTRAHKSVQRRHPGDLSIPLSRISRRDWSLVQFILAMVFTVPWKSRPLGGRPWVDKQIRDLIRRMSFENPLWGAPKIHGELLKLGIEVAQSTVSKYMVPRQGRPLQTWKIFLRNHADGYRLRPPLDTLTLTGGLPEDFGELVPQPLCATARRSSSDPVGRRRSRSPHQPEVHPQAPSPPAPTGVCQKGISPAPRAAAAAPRQRIREHV